MSVIPFTSVTRATRDRVLPRRGQRLQGDRGAAPRRSAEPLSRHAHVIVVGNEKGGSGKSTTAIHLIVGLLRSGRSVASIDLDVRQGTLCCFINNRDNYNWTHGLSLALPEHHFVERSTHTNRRAARVEEEERLKSLIAELRPCHDIIVIDTAGDDSHLARLGHAYADTLITPLNDSFVDLNLLAHVQRETLAMLGPSYYSEMVSQQMVKHRIETGADFDWIVMRNRLSPLFARNKRDMGRLIDELSQRMGFRVIHGLGERVVYRELFFKGLTVLDLRDTPDSYRLSRSHLSARQEIRTLVEALNLPALAKASRAAT